MKSLLTVKELSELLKISPCTIYRMVCEEYIPHIKIGHSVRFEERAIETWLAKRSKKGRATRRIEI